MDSPKHAERWKAFKYHNLNYYYTPSDDSTDTSEPYPLHMLKQQDAICNEVIGQNDPGPYPAPTQVDHLNDELITVVAEIKTLQESAETKFQMMNDTCKAHEDELHATKKRLEILLEERAILDGITSGLKDDINQKQKKLQTMRKLLEKWETHPQLQARAKTPAASSLMCLTIDPGSVASKPPTNLSDSPSRLDYRSPYEHSDAEVDCVGWGYPSMDSGW